MFNSYRLLPGAAAGRRRAAAVESLNVTKQDRGLFVTSWVWIRKQARTNMGSDLHFHKM